MRDVEEDEKKKSMQDTQQSKEKEDTGQGCRMRTGTWMMRDSNKDDNNNNTTIKK